MNKQLETVERIDFETLKKIKPTLQSFLGESIAQECIALISNAFNNQCEETDWKNTRICLVDGKKSFHIVSGTGIHNWVLYTEDGSIDIVKSVRKQYLDEVLSVEVINKRVLGRLIIKYIGNEGAEVDARKHSLRKLFQATIDYIQIHSVPDIWENSTVTVYDSEDNTFKIKSGNGKNKFMGNSGSQSSENRTVKKTYEATEYRTIEHAHFAVDVILRENPHLSYDAKQLLRDQRTKIYKALDGETSALITIYIGDENDDRPFQFKIGGGKQHLILNILNDKVKYTFSTGRFWTTFYKGVASLFQSLFNGFIAALPFTKTPNQIEEKTQQKTEENSLEESQETQEKNGKENAREN